MSTDTIRTSGPRLGSVDFTTNCCARQLLHQTAMPSTITTLPMKPPSVNRSPLRTSVSWMPRNGCAATAGVVVCAVATAVAVGVAVPEVGTAVEGGVDVVAGGVEHAAVRTARTSATIAARIT